MSANNFWRDATPVEIDGITKARVFYKHGLYCVCKQGVNPWDEEACTIDRRKIALQWANQLEAEALGSGK